MTKISVAIATHNEEKFIEGCLESVKWADEIIIVDGQSTDKTIDLAKKYKAKVFIVPNEPLMKKNMNLAFSKCTGDWVLSLDADERVTLDLKDEVLKIINSASQDVAYKIPRKNLMFGKYMEHTGWYPDCQIRLFKKGKAKFPAKNVHEDLEVNGSIGTLESDLDHLHYFTVDQWLEKMTSYTKYEAEKLVNENKKVIWTDAIKFPFDEFMSRFFAREGYKDGLHGLVFSLLMAFYWEIIYVRIWEHQKFVEHNSNNFLDEVVNETKKIKFGWNFWLEKITKNPVSKLIYKIKNKI